MKKILLLTLAVLATVPAFAQVKIGGPVRDAIMHGSRRSPNLKGVVPVVMYHLIGPQEKYMYRSVTNFRKDLERFYEMGFRPVTVTQYATNTMPLKPGESPIVLTFDDSYEEHIKFLAGDTIDPNCFVGVWLKFAETHPDFPVRGTFYVLKNGPFGPPHQAKKKIEMLRGWGSEIASHTNHHTNLAAATTEKVMDEIGGSYLYLKSLGCTPEAFAPPYGNFPHDRTYVKRFRYKGEIISFKSAVKAGAEPGLSPLDLKFNPYRIPRIIAAPVVEGLHWWLDRIERNNPPAYVQP